MPRYEIVPERSVVWIDAKSSVHPIHTKTAGLEGFVETDVAPDGTIDVSHAPKAHLALAVSKLSSGNPLQDRELRRRIAARQFPTIEGDLTDLVSTDVPARYRVSGAISFRGETRVYEHDMKIELVDHDTLRLTGEAAFDIRDFGLEPPRILMLKVEPDVVVRVDITAVMT